MDSVSREKQYGLETLAVALLCLGGSATSAYLLYNDFNQAGGAGKGKPIAHVQRREAKVRRKASSTYVWNNVQQDEALFRKDYLQTSAGSAVAIKFDDGAVLELAENSLIMIDDLTNLSLNFVKGQIVIHTATGDSRVTVGADGKAKVEELPVKQLKPEPLFRFYAPEKESKAVAFAWKKRDGLNELPAGSFIQVSGARSFPAAKTQEVAIADAKATEAQASLAAGTYFWRVVAPAADGAPKPLTETSQFRVVAAAPLKPVAPANGEKILSYGDGAPTAFRWQERPEESGGVEHMLEVARDADFKSVLFTRAIAAPSGVANLTGLATGDLYWRIRSTYADIRVASVAQKFNYGQLQKPNLELSFPEDRRSIESTPTLRFVWNSDAPDLEYAWEVQDAKNQAVQTSRGKASGATWKKPPAGAYKWRVTAFMKGHEVAQAPWRAFTVFEGSPIGLLGPVKNQEIYYWTTPTAFDLKWSADPLVQKSDYSYRVEISTEPDFKSATQGAPTKQTQVSHESLKIQPGSYHWRVAIVDANGEAIKVSKPEHFMYGPHPLLRAPEATFPAPNGVFNLVEKDEVPKTSWGAVPDAVAYEVTVYDLDAKRAPAQAGAPGKVIAQETVTGQELVLKSLKPGRYAWTVHAVDQAKRKGQALTLQNFTVTYGATLSSPEVLSPEVQ